MTDLTDLILDYVDRNSSVNTVQLSEWLKEDHQKIVGAVKSIQASGNLIDVEQCSSKSWDLTDEGVNIANNGSHEALIFHAIPSDGILQPELMKSPTAKIGFSKAMSLGWIWIDKSGNKPLVKKKVKCIDDTVQQLLKKIQEKHFSEISEVQKQDLKKRKLLQEITIKTFVLTKGADFNTSLTKLETDLTLDMLTKQSWKDQKFKSYNFDALGQTLSCGHLHPLLKVRAEFRQIFLEMGFEEMPTNNFIESSFWNFDALFQPQQHPARDSHDTFFISDPEFARNMPMEYLEKVKKVHEHGGYGSQGYNYEWKLETAQKNLLRTHTTAVSARMLHLLAQQKEFRPAKYFSIDRVYRNETLDATHLAEFHQIEGLIVDYNLTLGHLIGVLYEFFKKLGITKLRFKPAYNPYTEPSMEIFSYHEGLKKWVEVGNSGVFRPEMLMPMGLPETVQVVAWGLSLERPTMIKYGINNIRSLVGQKVDLHMVQENPICRLEKNYHSADTKISSNTSLISMEKIQENILNKLRKIQNDICRLEINLGVGFMNSSQSGMAQQRDNGISKDALMTNIRKEIEHDIQESIFPELTVYCSPRRPMWSLLALQHLMRKHFCMRMSSDVHGSAHYVDVRLKDFFSATLSRECITTNCLPQQLHLCWREIGDDAILMVDRTSIFGEVNVLRYLGKLISLGYGNDPVLDTVIDDWLDRIYSCVHSGYNKAWEALLNSLNVHLLQSKWLVGDVYTLADLAMWSALYQTRTVDLAPPNVKKWINASSLLPWISPLAEFINSYS